MLHNQKLDLLESQALGAVMFDMAITKAKEPTPETRRSLFSPKVTQGNVFLEQDHFLPRSREMNHGYARSRDV